MANYRCDICKDLITFHNLNAYRRHLYFHEQNERKKQVKPLAITRYEFNKKGEKFTFHDYRKI